ncbi:MAG: copper homeostasis protein CutC [Proteobacteria bacterium]|uniref:copper homeostasis protein CutC n=1 Tax=Rudaea sp. TaxID=2136325 RepID=UPI0037849FAA|nr:copper homeostasis protein CutC [Pseudomonadota bacterium]
MPLLEIAAASIASALAAQEGGADRIELCANLREGGTTPSHGTLVEARKRLRIPIHVLVRPRGGDFLYSELEAEAMLGDIEDCVRSGADGVVIGALDADGNVDVALCRRLVAAAGTLDITFHRAFDTARDPAAALEDIIALGCARVLTSGAAASAAQGADAIANHVRRARGRIAILAGGGVRADNVRELVARTGVVECHSSAGTTRRSGMRLRREDLPGLEPDFVQTDVARVRAIVAALREA